MLHFFAHLHPLLVHLPIGILLMAFALECLARWGGRVQLLLAARLALVIGFFSAAISAISGYVLANSGDYDAAAVSKHQWWGIATTLVFGILWSDRLKKWAFPVFIAGIGMLVVTGHFGGVLTHGEGYLFSDDHSDEPAATASSSALNPDAVAFEALIQPILKQKCVNCHRPEKKKGDLILSTMEGMMAGGKHGNAIVAGNPDSSLVFQRIHLPLTHDDHMPPSSKAQLSDLEVKLLSWWISSGADFKATFKEKPLPEDLATQLAGSGGISTNPVFSRKVNPATAAAVEKLKSLGIHVEKLGTDQPWLAVSLAGLQSPGPKHWDALGSVNEQIVDLDLSHTNASEKDLNSISFPNIVRLNLASSKTGPALTKTLEKMPFLSVLNVTGTAVDNSLQQILPRLKYLESLYIWQSAITGDEADKWRHQYPKLRIEGGAVIPDGASLTLRPPKLLYGRSFFNDTMHVELNFPFSGVDIYYTLDEAASPTTESPKYTDVLVLDKTSHLRAFASKTGWNQSSLVDAIFVKKKYTLAGSTLKALPSPKYPAKGAPSLIDGKIADAQGSDTWLGYEGEHMEATLDLGEKRDVSEVFVHCLENNNSWIFKPVAIKVFTSMDGRKYDFRAEEKFAPNTSMGEQKAHLLGCHFKQKETARYVRVKVENLLKNPSWHPGKGQKCWIFVDEITLE